MEQRTAPPRLEPEYLYLLICIQVLQDGVIDDEEQEYLDHLRTVLGISDKESGDLLARARAEYENGHLVEGGNLDPETAFESACVLAWADGWLEEKEKILLRLVGRIFKLSEDRANEIMASTRAGSPAKSS